jgi:catechol 2,3-dioxygenase-like lactoylglutathione lyase family enzyme
MNAHLRIARPTDDLDRTVAMYRRGLDLELLGSFRDHDGFDGAMLGVAGGHWHLEFTEQRGRRVPGAPTGDDLLAFYLPDTAEWHNACERMLRAGFAEVAAHNPYWNRQGRTFADPDGYRVVLQNEAWAPVTGT